MVAALTCLGLLLVAAVLGRMSWMMLRADPIEAEKNARRMGTVRNAIMGRVQIHDDWIPDSRVQGGMVFNKKEQRFEICGRISDESLDRTFQ